MLHFLVERKKGNCLHFSAEGNQDYKASRITGYYSGKKGQTFEVAGDFGKTAAQPCKSMAEARRMFSTFVQCWTGQRVKLHKKF